MAKVLNSAQMREADRRTIEELGLPGMVLMENAGAAVTRLLKRRFPEWKKRTILVLAGQGNNGGDGFVVARRLHQGGARVGVFLLGRCDALRGDALRHCHVYERGGGTVQEVEDHTDLRLFDGRLAHAGLVVDAVFGTGLTRPVVGITAHIFEKIQRSGKPVLAVDLPSGVSADTGQVLGVALPAQWTVTFAAEKVGHRLYPGAGLCGEVVVADIGIPPIYLDIPEHAVARNLMVDLVMPCRPADAHKGTLGHVLILAGSVGKEGAAVLTALGALRTGPGLVTVATPQAARPGVTAKLTESMTLPLPTDEGRDAILSMLHASAIQPDVLAMGPGFGGDDWVFDTLQDWLGHFDVPAVLDADALNVLAKRQRDHPLTAWGKRRHAPLVLTPHPGEFARLLACSVAEVQADRLTLAMKAAKTWHVWLVLKGAGTVIAAPDGRAWINDTGNTGLAAGGSGDLLTGIIAGLLAQRWPTESAVRAGVWLHGTAADTAAQEAGQAGLMASDLLPHVRHWRNTL